MKIEIVSINELGSEGSSENDFKKMLSSVNNKSKSERSFKVRTVKKPNKQKDNKRKKRVRNSANMVEVLFPEIERRRNRSDMSLITSVDLEKIKSKLKTTLAIDNINPQDISIYINHVSFIDNNNDTNIYPTKKEVNNKNVLMIETQMINQSNMLTNKEYISVKAMRHYQVYYKGKRYYFNIDKQGILSEKEDENDSS